MDKSRTVLMLSNLPKNLWGFSIMISIHLIHRLPSKTIGLRNPIKILEELYSKVKLRNGLTPRVLGCISYDHSHNMQTDKLFAKAMKCALFGHSNTQKVYKFYHPKIREIIVTRDVIFDENEFYYHSYSESTLKSEVERVTIPLPRFQLIEHKEGSHGIEQICNR